MPLKKVQICLLVNLDYGKVWVWGMKAKRDARMARTKERTEKTERRIRIGC